MEMIHEWKRGDYLVSTDKGLLDLNVIHDFLSNRSYWAQGRTMEKLARSIENSIAFGVYRQGVQIEQLGFARAITDYTTFTWVADVFILEPFRGQGLGVWLMECVVAHPELQDVYRWVLATRNAHDLYRKTGFKELENCERWMGRGSMKRET